jgi:putative ABC transport system permease protein
MSRTDSLLRDIRYGFRVLYKTPAFFIVSVVILGLGIGANTVMFSVVNALVIRPLPFPNADRLVRVWHVPPPAQFPGATTFSVSPANYLDWRAQNGVFGQMAIYTEGSANLTAPGQEPDAVRAGIVSTDFFDVLGVTPIRGRLFAAGEDEPGKDDVVVLGESLWLTRFGGDPGIVGRTIVVNARQRTVVGIVANAVAFPLETSLWVPLAFSAEERGVRGIHDFAVIARLKPGVAIEQAQAEMDTISRRLAQEYPADNTGWGAIVIDLQDDLVGEAKTALLVLVGAVGFVMLIASANLANLLLARTLARAREIAVRTALGAGRGQVVRQVLCETILLGLFGGAFGMLLAQSALAAIVAFVALELPRADAISLDARVLAFTFGVSIVAGILAGVAPAWQLTRTNVHDALKQGLSRTATGSSERRVRNALVVSEVALALVLLVGAGLLIRTIGMLRSVDPGFDPRSVFTASLAVPTAKYAKPEEWTRFFEQVAERVRAVPGVEIVAGIDSLPMTGGSRQPVVADGDPERPMSEQPEVAVRRIMPGYLRAMRTRLLAGRDFIDSDIDGRAPVVLVSESMARQFWPNQNAVGKRLTLTFYPGIVWEVVGVVDDVKLHGLDVQAPVAALYTTYAQRSAPFLSLVVRTRVPPMSIAPSVAAAVHAIDPELPVLGVRTLDEVVGSSISRQRFAMQLLGAFASLALFLAAIGIYSVLSYTVRQRGREIGIRMALGAQAPDVVRMVVADGIKPTLAGLVIGLVCALALGRLMSSMVFGVTAHDPITLTAVAGIITLVGAAATLVPAYRAARIEPLTALREEQ